MGAAEQEAKENSPGLNGKTFENKNVECSIQVVSLTEILFSFPMQSTFSKLD